MRQIAVRELRKYYLVDFNVVIKVPSPVDYRIRAITQECFNMESPSSRDKSR